MPKVGNKKFAYTFTGMKKARAAAAKARLAAVKAEKAKGSKIKPHTFAPAPAGSGMGEGEEAKHKKALAKYHSEQADKPSPHSGGASGKDLMKFGGGASQSTFNVKKEYAKQKAGDEKFAQGPTPHEVFEFDKKAKKQEAKFQSKLKETRYLADAKAAREGVLDLKGTKAPPLPKNWRTLDKNSGIRQLFREWYKQNRGKKAKTKRPTLRNTQGRQVNLRKHLARFERATGQK
tara:strand:- start:3242 stop:3940 length:699 start_codon:yes stop_codon:yes gene_type:complete